MITNIIAFVMECVFIVYLLSVINIHILFYKLDILFYKLGQNLDSLTRDRTRIASFPDEVGYQRCYICF